jgi:hypothetical protein
MPRRILLTLARGHLVWPVGKRPIFPVTDKKRRYRTSGPAWRTATSGKYTPMLEFCWAALRPKHEYGCLPRGVELDRFLNARLEGRCVRSRDPHPGGKDGRQPRHHRAVLEPPLGPGVRLKIVIVLVHPLNSEGPAFESLIPTAVPPSIDTSGSDRRRSRLERNRNSKVV